MAAATARRTSAPCIVAWSSPLSAAGLSKPGMARAGTVLCGGCPPACGRPGGRSVQEVQGVGAIVDEVDAGPVGHHGQAEQSAVAVRARWCRAGVQYLHGDLLATWGGLDQVAVAAV